MKNKIIKVKKLNLGNNLPLTLIAGPCQIESKDHCHMIASKIKDITSKLNIGFIFKSSFDKANRTSIKSKRGVGLDKSLSIFDYISKDLEVPILTDVHNEEQCRIVSKVVDIIQIPAFLCRQTDLLVAAAKTNKVVNVKKGQFLDPQSMSNVVNKITHTGNLNVMLCERGTSFGYTNLFVDYRGLEVMKRTGYPVIFDATHSVQHPGANGVSSGGDREMVWPLAKAACAIGVAGIFMEMHEDPDRAPSDGANMIKIHDAKVILQNLRQLDTLAKNN